MSGSGNMIPQSRMMMRPSTSMQAQLRPISPRPPRKTTRTGFGCPACLAKRRHLSAGKPTAAMIWPPGRRARAWPAPWAGGIGPPAGPVPASRPWPATGWGIRARTRSRRSRAGPRWRRWPPPGRRQEARWRHGTAGPTQWAATLMTPDRPDGEEGQRHVVVTAVDLEARRRLGGQVRRGRRVARRVLERHHVAHLAGQPQHGACGDAATGTHRDVVDDDRERGGRGRHRKCSKIPACDGRL